MEYINDPLPPLTRWEAMQEGALEERESILNERMRIKAYERKRTDLARRFSDWQERRRANQT